MRPGTLFYFYRRRLRVHAVQELLAGLGVTIGVALVFATIVASASVSGSVADVVRAVIGPASLQLHARSAGGFDQRLLARVEPLAGVKQAAPLLEQTATLTGPGGRRVTVDLAGADASLVALDGLLHTLPTSTLSAGGIGLSRSTAEALGIASSAGSAGTPVRLQLRGRATSLRVSAVLGPEAFGALSQALVAVMPLAQLQQLAGLQGRITRILVQTRPGHTRAVRQELTRLAGRHLDVTAADRDVSLLRQALRPSDQANGFFAAISALLGLLFAAGALLITVPERRRAIADLRLIGAQRSAIAQMLLFQALCLGTIASAVGLLGGYLLSLGVFHQSPRYLAEAFTLGTRTVVGTQPLVLAFLGGVLVTCAASATPLLDLRRGRALDAVYRGEGVPGNALSSRARRWLALVAVSLLMAASILFAAAVALALLASALLALATVAMVPLALAGVLRLAQALAERWQRLTVLPVALRSLRSTTLRALALAATGAVALFGSIALGGARGDLLRGIHGFAHSYAADASLWVGTPGDNQAVVDFRGDGLTRRLTRLPGVAGVRTFQGGFLELGDRRVWILARPPGAEREVLSTQILEGHTATTIARLGASGWIALSRQIAEEHHVGLGDTLMLATPSGPVHMRVAATTTNLAWSPGVIFMGTADYRRLWHNSAPTALAVALATGASATEVKTEITRTLGPASGLQATSALEREASINTLTSEGLGQLGEISTLLLLAAILAMAVALASAIWQRRASLASLRLAGVRPRRLRRVLLTESTLILSAGCVTGALAGIYGQIVIDSYLAHVTGFPVASLDAGLRPLEILALVVAVVLAVVAIPGYLASRVPPSLAFDE
ncbi:MAG TPA: FtsX-like permease family protein [Solirubrobacteraceae bacterium]|jgi:putative ABC transport system permease protein